MVYGWRYGLPLLLVAGVLALAASLLIDMVSHEWFERDVEVRGELAARSINDGLVADLQAGNQVHVKKVLDELTRDEKITGAALCDTEGRIVYASQFYPHPLGCGSSKPFETLHLRSGPVHVGRFALHEGDVPVANLLLVHDLSFLAQRESIARRVLVAGVLLMGSLAFLVTMGISRWSIRAWIRSLRGVGRFAEEQTQALAQGIPWNPAALKNVLARNLQGDRVIVVANREPYMHVRIGDDVSVVHPASGLVTALEPVMRACSGTWIAHGSGPADRETSDRDGRLAVPPGDPSYILRRIWLTPEQEAGYYYGFSNEGLWALCHTAHTRPLFRLSDWEHYQTVNRMFADAVVQEATSNDPIVLVQDYHFALVPRMVRERLPKATIITFWHIPWPSAERVAICPWAAELLTGLLGSSIMGFHTQSHVNYFIDTVDHFLEARIDRESQGVVSGGRETLIRPYPISIEWPNTTIDHLPSVRECRAEIIAQYGLADDCRIGIGVDRIDYTKGIEERLLAVERVLEKYPQHVGKLVFMQLGAPSRTTIETYKKLNEEIEAQAQRINERFGKNGYQPIVFLRAHHEPDAIYRCYRAADFCYVSSLHDGMNLVAKEYVAARDDLAGVLILSHFTGAARELTEALVVNPYDLEQAAEAIQSALTMPRAEQLMRMQSMRRVIAEHNVYRWAGKMLVDAAKLRERERLSGRLRHAFA